MIGGVALALDQITRLEVDKPIGAGSDRLQICRRFAGIGPFVGLEQMFRDDHAELADEGARPEWRRLGKMHANGERIDLFDFNVPVVADRRGGGCRVAGIFAGEHDIVGGERMAVVPLHVFLELPGHRHAVGRDPAILDIRDFGGERRRQIAVEIPSCERLVENARALLVLGADGEMRVEQGRGLPEQHLERAAAAGFGRLVLGLGRGLRHAGMGQQPGRKGRCEAEADHLVHKGAARHAPCLHGRDQISQVSLVHGEVPDRHCGRQSVSSNLSSY